MELAEAKLVTCFSKTPANTVLRDTQSLTHILANNEFPEDALLVTADIVSLYTNMHC